MAAAGLWVLMASNKASGTGMRDPHGREARCALVVAFGAAALIAAVPGFSASPALAQSQATGFSGIGGANSKKPIDIESDRLEVDDKRHVAIFIGNVSATQGDYNLRSRQLEVTYENAPQSGAPQSGDQARGRPKPQNANAAADDPLTSGQIKFIHATGGKVLLTSKKDQQEASGDEAFYDVKGQKITMTGEEVILTQKGNIVKGKKLLINLATGRAIVDPEKGRVRAVFEQTGKLENPLADKKQKDGGASKESPKPVSGATGWEVQSR
ncbi:MAG TPA: LptA/OstA family protein [Hyphomicrobiales bacterium]|nr:LptA/OstA family protein [Hyphomicrobiales bacterium]